MPFERRAHHDQPRARAVDQRHLGRGEFGNPRAAESDQQIIGQAGEGMDQRLAIMAGRIKPQILGQCAKGLAQHGHFAGRALNAALVHSPAWIESAVMRPFSRCGTMNRSSGLRRWTRGPAHWT